MRTPQGTTALVRGIPHSYDRCLANLEPGEKIDVSLAREQHRRYCEVLERLGLSLIRIEPDDGLPDCCFVEDPAMVFGDKAVISNLKMKSRKKETEEVEKSLSRLKKILHIEPPAFIDGGDVLRIGNTLYVGISLRTNPSAVQQLNVLLEKDGYHIIPVPLKNILHLKSACTYMGDNLCLLAPGHFDEALLAGQEMIPLPQSEGYAANCLAINGKVLISKGYPQARRLIEGRGFETIEMETSEFRKGGGSLTCLSIIF